MAKVKTTANKIKRRLDTVKLKSLGIESYDFDNLYPQRVSDISNDSGTTTSCLRVYNRFVNGSGFTDPELGKFKLNREGLTVDKLRAKLVKSIGTHNGGVIHFNYNGLGEKTEINFIPFAYGRLTLEESEFANRLAIYYDWEQKQRAKIDKKKLKYIHKYAPHKVLEEVQQEEVKLKGDEDDNQVLAMKFDQYLGQVMYWTPNGQDQYPLAPFDSVLEDCITEAQTKRFKTNSATRNFMPSHIVVTGKEQSEQDEDNNPIESDEDGLGKTLNEFQGGDGVAKMLHIEKDSEEEPFEIHKVEIQDYDGFLEHTENSATEDIVRTFNIPDILVLRREGGLGGNGSELYEAKEYYNDITQHDRDIISGIIEECLKGFAGNPQFEDYSIAPLRYQKPIASSESSSIMLVIKDTELSREQKSELLSLVHRLPKDKIDKLLGP